MVWRFKEYRPGSRRRSFPCSCFMLNRSLETNLTRVGVDTTSRSTVDDDWSFGYAVIVTVSVSLYDPCDSVCAGMNRSLLPVLMSWSREGSSRQSVEQRKIFHRVEINDDREQFNLIVDVMRMSWVRRNFNESADGTNWIRGGKQSKVTHSGKTSVIRKNFSRDINRPRIHLLQPSFNNSNFCIRKLYSSATYKWPWLWRWAPYALYSWLAADPDWPVHPAIHRYSSPFTRIIRCCSLSAM